ncbi:MAG: T9SS type A sorting domain-containing protein [Bacteroidia bacterium]|nr:T9SS type A sorting domain-containing protein [Bacteroidia bacterium]
MKIKLLPGFFILILIFLLAPTPSISQSTTPKWSKLWNSSGSNRDQGYAVATDASGNVYITGIANSDPSTANSWIETKKYNSSGTLQWTTTYDGGSCSCAAGRENGLCIAVDGSGNVWVAASIYNTTTYYSDLALIKYNSSGVIQSNYPKRYQDASGTGVWVMGTSLAVYNSTNVYIAGLTYTSTSGYKLIVLKDTITTNNYTWGWNNTPYTYQGTNSTGGHSAYDLKINSNNTSLYVTGQVSNTSVGTDVFTAKLSPSLGTATWTATWNNSTYSLNDSPLAMAIDGSGNVYVAGYTTTTGQGTDALLLSYNSSGSLRSGYPAIYNSSNNLDDQWSDIALGPGGGAGDGAALVGGRTRVASSPLNENYLLAAYLGSSGAFLSGWGTNPVTYDGTAGTPEAAGTDQGWAVEYVSSSDRVYISGRSHETSGGVNITTIGYDGSDGSLVWGPASFDYGSDVLVGRDEVAFKYELNAKYNAVYCVDEIFIAGQSYVANQELDYVTIKYSCGVCVPCLGPGGRFGNMDQDVGLRPNPIYDVAILRLSSEIEISGACLYIYDLAGNLVRIQNDINTNAISIEKGQLVSGLYFYRLVGKDQVFISGKFVIAH